MTKRMGDKSWNETESGLNYLKPQICCIPTPLVFFNAIIGDNSDMSQKALGTIIVVIFYDLTWFNHPIQRWVD